MAGSKTRDATREAIEAAIVDHGALVSVCYEGSLHADESCRYVKRSTSQIRTIEHAGAAPLRAGLCAECVTSGSDGHE